LGKNDAAREYFILEREAFPYSALYAGFELAMLEISKSSIIDIAKAKQRLIRNLELRNLTTADAAMLNRSPQLDDQPLKWSKLK
jgi:hypothetical protein